MLGGDEPPYYDGSGSGRLAVRWRDANGKQGNVREEGEDGCKYETAPKRLRNTGACSAATGSPADVGTGVHR